MTVVKTLEGMGGVARARELLAAGVSRGALAKACERREVLRMARGVYALPEHDAASLTALSMGTDLACVSAATQRGLWIYREARLLHVAADHGRSVTGAAVRVHRAARPVSDLAMCLQVMRCLPELDALCIVESAVVLGLVTLKDLRPLGTGHRSGGIREILALVDPHSESVLETVARYHLVKAGFKVATQVHVAGVGRLDLFVDGILGVETDGYRYHSDRQAFEEDRRRWNLLTLRNVPLLSVTRNLLFDDPDKFVQLIRGTLAAHQRGRRIA